MKFRITYNIDNQATNRILLGLSLTVVILISFIIVTVLILIILFLLRVFKKLQIQHVNLQTAAVNSSTPVSTDLQELSQCSTRCMRSDGSDQVVDVENLAYSREDYVKSPSNSGRTADNTCRGNSIIYYDITHIPGWI